MPEQAFISRNKSRLSPPSLNNLPPILTVHGSSPTSTPSAPPLVSVITVCFNLVKNGRSDFFKICAESVHRQKYPQVEHIVIDGGSQDGTRELLEDYAARKWIRFISEPDKGIYDAMNKGIRAAQGKYVAFLNSDDYWHDPDGVEASVRALEESGAAFSYAPRNRVNEQGDFLFREEAGLGAFPFLMPFCHQTMFTRRDILQKYNGFDQERYHSAADYDLVLRLILGGERGIYVPHNFTTFRSGGFSEDTKGGRTQDETYLVRRNLLGEQAAEMISKGYLDDELMQRLLGMLHPRVAFDLLRCVTPDGPGCYSLTYGLVTSKTPGQYSPGFTRNKRYSLALFGFIPFTTVKIRNKRADYSLFGILPLLRIKTSDQKRTFLLFWAIPVLSIKF